MLKHLGEELVPFESNGFAREPEFPRPGETVTVRCRVDFTKERPLMTLRDAAGERTLEGTTTDGRFYAFALGTFAQPQQVRYLLREFDVGAVVPEAIELTNEQQLFAKLKRPRSATAQRRLDPHLPLRRTFPVAVT